MAIMGLDLGTSGCKSVVCSPDGKYISGAYREYTAQRDAGAHELDANVMWDCIREVIAIGAAVTVLLIVLVCGFVFVGILGDYLEEDVLPESADYEFNIADMEQTSYVYYVDGSGEIQLLQQIHCRQRYTSCKRRHRNQADVFC